MSNHNVKYSCVKNPKPYITTCLEAKYTVFEKGLNSCILVIAKKPEWLCQCRRLIPNRKTQNEKCYLDLKFGLRKLISYIKQHYFKVKCFSRCFIIKIYCSPLTKGFNAINFLTITNIHLPSEAFKFWREGVHYKC